MPKITFIGAGSLVFTRNLCNDILLTPALQDSEIVLMDIDPRRLEMASTLITALAEKRGGKARISSCLDRSTALAGADYVMATFLA